MHQEKFTMIASKNKNRISATVLVDSHQMFLLTMDNNCVWLKTMVRVGCELLVFVTDVLGLLHVVVVCASVGAFNSATVVVKSAVFTTF